MKRFLINIFFCVLSFPVFAQVFQVMGEYKKLPAQGMAIYGKKCYMLNITGHCRVFDLKKKSRRKNPAAYKEATKIIRTRRRS